MGYLSLSQPVLWGWLRAFAPGAEGPHSVLVLAKRAYSKTHVTLVNVGRHGPRVVALTGHNLKVFLGAERKTKKEAFPVWALKTKEEISQAKLRWLPWKILGWIIEGSVGTPAPENKIYICIQCENQFRFQKLRDYFIKSMCPCGGKYYPLDEVKWIEEDEG